MIMTRTGSKQRVLIILAGPVCLVNARTLLDDGLDVAVVTKVIDFACPRL